VAFLPSSALWTLRGLRGHSCTQYLDHSGLASLSLGRAARWRTTKARDALALAAGNLLSQALVCLLLLSMLAAGGDAQLTSAAGEQICAVG
jgi:hypothetical protein